MKIVDIAEFYADQGGGVKTYIHQKLEAGAREGHEVVVIAPGRTDGEEARHGGRVLWVKGPPMPFDPRYTVLWRERAVHELLDREQPDLVEGSSPWTGGWFAARWRGPAAKTFVFHADPVAVYPQTFFGQRFGTDRVDRMFGWYWSYLRHLSARFDATVVSGHWLAKKLRRFGLRRPEAVPFGIRKERFSPRQRSEALRQEWLAACGCSPDAALLVNISRFHPEKRVGTLIDGFERARQKQQRELGLVIFGAGPLQSWVEKRAAGVPGLHLAGFVADRERIAATLASADAMIHGSAAETYGIVVAEAICSGLPVVVPDQGGAADLARAGHAEVYAAGHAAGLAQAIVRLLDRDAAALRAACAVANRDQIWTMDRHFTELFAFYGRLADEARTTPR